MSRSVAVARVIGGIRNLAGGWRSPSLRAGAAAVLALAATLLAAIDRTVVADLPADRFDHSRGSFTRDSPDVEVDAGPSYARVPYVLPGPLDGWAGGRPHALNISIGPLRSRALRLWLDTVETHEVHPPVLTVGVNEHVVARVATRRGTGLPPPHGTRGVRSRYRVDIPKAAVGDGDGLRVRIASESGSWVMWRRIWLTEDAKSAAWAHLAYPGAARGLAAALLAGGLLALLIPDPGPPGAPRPARKLVRPAAAALALVLLGAAALDPDSTLALAPRWAWLAVPWALLLVHRWPPDIGADTACLALIGIGAGLRLRQYLYGRSLWLDEARLANNVVDRSFAELWGPLDYEPAAPPQVAPPGFVYAAKIVSLVLGDSERALRLVPFLAAILALVGFYVLARRILGPWALVGAVALFALSEGLIRYANEFKQYSVDVLVAVLVYLLADRFAHKRLAAWPFALFGAGVLWFSHPSVFVLAGVGASVMAAWLWDGKWRSARALGFCIAAWLVSFALLYWLSLAAIRTHAYFQHSSFWAGGYMPVPWTTAGGLAWLDYAFWELVHLAVTKAGGGSLYGRAVEIALGLSMLAALVGLSITHRRRLFFLLSPILVALLASLLRLYPFMDRLVLFLVPGVVLLMASGLELLCLRHERIPPVVKALMLVGVLGLPAAVQWSALAFPAEAEEVRPVMDQLARRRRPADRIYVYYGAWPAVRYYMPFYGLSPADVVRGTRSRDDPDGYLRELEDFRHQRRVWLVFSHDYRGCCGSEEELIVAELERSGRRLSQFRVTGASLYLFGLGTPPDQPTAGGTAGQQP